MTRGTVWWRQGEAGTRPGERRRVRSKCSRRSNNRWRPDEQEQLVRLVERYGTKKKWSEISEHIEGAVPLPARWIPRLPCSLLPSDCCLCECVRLTGGRPWLAGRTGKQCRERWMNHLR